MLERSHGEWFTSIFHQQASESHCQKEEKKNVSQNSFPPLHYVCMCGFCSPYETKGTHEGRFITRHVSPMCCCTKIDHKSSSVQLCLIKENPFSLNADPEIKCHARRRTVNKREWQKSEWKWLSDRTLKDLFFRGSSWISQLCIHRNDSVIHWPLECHRMHTRMQTNVCKQIYTGSIKKKKKTHPLKPLWEDAMTHNARSVEANKHVASRACI